MQKSSLCRVAKEKARAILRKERLSFPLFLLCLLVFLSIVGGTLLLWRGIFFFVMLGVTNITSAALVAFVLFCLGLCLLFAPLWKGIKATLFQQLVLGRMDYKTVFLYFSHPKRYFFAVRHALAKLLQILGFLAVFGLVARLGKAVAQTLFSVERVAAACFVLCVSILLLFLLLLFYFVLRSNSFLVGAAHLCAPLLSDRQLRALSKSKMQGGRRALFRLELSFLPLFLLSAPLLFFPLVFLFPYYLMSRVCLSYHLLSN